MRPNFEACGQEFLAHAWDRYPQYIFNGTNRVAASAGNQQPPLITLEGCRKLCGAGTEYYAWCVPTLLGNTSVHAWFN